MGSQSILKNIVKIKSKLFFLFICIGIIALAIFVRHDLNGKALLQKQKCPDDYADTDAGSKEYLASMDKWTNEFYDTHPGASLGDWSATRYQFWIDNNCVVALERYEAVKNSKAEEN